MIRIKRSRLVDKLREISHENKGQYSFMVNDAIHGNGNVTLSYLIKRGHFKFPKDVIQKEILTCQIIGKLNERQVDQMTNILYNCDDGQQRIMNYFRRNKRIVLV